MLERSVAPRCAMVLAAGFGTRLRPLTLELPKPLLPLGDRSVLAHIVDGLVGAGIERLVVNCHHLADAFASHMLAELALEPRLLRETEILGTAGGVANAAADLGPGAALIVNGDILAEVDVEALWRAHAAGPAGASLALAAPLPAGQGSVGIDAAGRVVRLRDGRYGHEVAGGDFVGVQLLDREVRQHLPEQGCLVGDLYMPLLAAGTAVHAYHVAAGFADIGTPASYLAANLDWLGERPRYVAAGVERAAQVDVVDAVIGAGARLGGAGQVRRVVAWPGARFDAPLQDAIVTSAGRIVAL